jgi:aspartate kinase
MTGNTGNIRSLENLLVVKFGGKALSSPIQIRKLAQKTLEFHEERPTLVVVSAMGDDTNKLIRIADEVSGGDCLPSDLTQIVSFGENLCSSVFSTAIRSLGFNAEAVTPSSEFWPIFAESEQEIELAREKINQNVDVRILEEYSKNRALEGIGQLLKNNIIPVVSGFLAKTRDNRLITLGRGGSDTSAFLLAKLLGASEVIIVTDVQGVMKADPRKISDTEKVNYISIDEIDSITRSGGQVLHPQSLAFKTDRMKARIVHFEETDYQAAGTEIIGFYKAQLKGIRKKLALITFVGEELSTHQDVWSEIGTMIAQINIPLYGLSFTESFIGFYISDEHSEILFHKLGEIARDRDYIKNIIQRKGIARLNLCSRDNAENPSMISEICETLLERGVRVLEIITNQSDISVFVDWSDRREADRLFKRIATDINLREVLKKET